MDDVNRYKMREAIECLLNEIDSNWEKDVHLKDTPTRVTKAYNSEIFSGYKQNPKSILTSFLEEDKYDEMIIIKDIDFFSMCAHHMLPFFGKIHIGYVHNGKVVGASKLPRFVDCFSRRLQIQERLTRQIANTFMEVVKPKGVGVVCEAQHFCMISRGVKKINTKMTTSALRGVFLKEDPNNSASKHTRQEFMNLIK